MIQGVYRTFGEDYIVKRRSALETAPDREMGPIEGSKKAIR